MRNNIGKYEKRVFVTGTIGKVYIHSMSCTAIIEHLECIDTEFSIENVL